MKFIAPHLYTFENCLVGRAYLLEDADGLTIIDGSIAPSTNAILRQITGSGRRLTDVKRILLITPTSITLARCRNSSGRAARRSSAR